MESSRYSEAYKLKAGTMDRRLIRAQRRSVDWKNQRQGLLDKKRNMSPLQEREASQNSSADDNISKTTSRNCEADSRKSRLSKWKLEKEAKKKREAAEKAKKGTFKVGKMDHKESDLYTGFKCKTIKAPEIKKSNLSIQTKKIERPIRNLKRKGDEQQSSVNKKPVLDKNLISDTSVTVINPLIKDRHIKRTRTPPSKRITRQTKNVASRLFAPTASSAAKQVGVTEKLGKPKKTTTKCQPAAISKPGPSNTDNKKPIFDKVSTTRGDVGFPDNYSFMAPSNLEAFAFKPLSPNSVANFIFTNQHNSSVSFFINSPEGRCSTPRDNGVDTGKGDAPNFDFSVTVTNDLQDQTETDVNQKENVEQSDSDDVDKKSFQARRSLRQSLPSRTTTTDEVQIPGMNEDISDVNPEPVLNVESDNSENMKKERTDNSLNALSDRIDSMRTSVPKADVSTPTNTKSDSSKRLSKSDNKVISRDDGFRTPGVPLSAQRRTRRKTVASSTPTLVRSPEEWVKILEKSPMIEMARRTPKSNKSPELNVNSIQPLSFDDLEDEIPHFSIVDDEVFDEPDSTTTVEVDMDAKVEEDGDMIVTCDNSVTDSVTHDVKYFRDLTKRETDRLQSSGDSWTSYLERTNQLTEEVEGCIRTVVGQSSLLIAQRFKQFIDLVDDCQFLRGEKETTYDDLQGFWDMIYFQVEDVHKKFEVLTQRKEKNWVEETKVTVKKNIKKKSTKCVKPAGKSKFAAFRNEMVKQKEEKSSMKVSPQMTCTMKTFDAGFFKVNSPIKISPHFHCEAGTSKKSKVVTVDEERTENQQKNLTEPEETETTENKLKDPSPKRQPLSVLESSGNDIRTPRRKSYAPNVPSPLLHDITPKPKTRRSLAVNTPKNIVDEFDACPLSSPKPLKITTPISSNKTPKTKEDITPRRRSLRIRKSVCFTATPNDTAPIVEEDDLTKFLQPSATVSSPAPEENESSLANKEDSPFSFKYFQQNDSATKCATKGSAGKRKSLKRRPSDERRRSTRKSVHFDSSSEHMNTSDRLQHTPYNRDSLVAKSRIGEKDLLFTPDEKDQLSLQGIKSRPSLLFTPERGDKENMVLNKDNLMSFTP